MLDTLKKLLEKYHDAIVYLIFGVLTTIVNYLVYLPCYNLLGLSSAVSNAIAWAAAVIFAFLTNKPLVFRSHDWSAGVVIPELVKFIGTRVSSGVLETAILFLTVDVLGYDGNVLKILLSVLVVVLNYVGSKFLVFRK